MEITGASCPVSGKQVNETVVRLVAAQVIILTGISLITQQYWISIALAIDFFLRAFTNRRYSVLKWSAFQLQELFGLSYKFTDEAPKRFAAGIGFAVMLLLIFSQLIGWSIFSAVIGGMLVLFASLESLFAICVGCYLYQFISQWPWRQRSIIS
jgi:hypothetical protein